jgi:ketose-bisphosphate aldolase
VDGLVMALAILEAAEKANAPVVAVIWQENIRSVGKGYLETIIKYGASRVRVPIAIMLDHGTDLATCLESMLHGHSGVMIDASHHPVEENIRLTREVCDLAHLVNVSVEGELGTIRRSFEKTGYFSEATNLTEPSLVPTFVQRTGIDALAISIGTESGITSEPQKLDFERLRKIAASTEAYLIVHGGSGTPGEEIRRAIQYGVTAFRFASEIWLAYLQAMQTAFTCLPADCPDTRLVFEPAREAAKQLIIERMEHLGCIGKAS